MALTKTRTKTRAGSEHNLFEETADLLADRVIEKHWAYYTGAGAAISFAAGLLIFFLYYLSSQPLYLYVMPAWFLIMGSLMYLHYVAYTRMVSWRGYTQLSLIGAVVLWPISVAIVFALA